MSPHDRRHNRDVLNLLMEKASTNGYVTTDDLMDISPEVSTDFGRMSVILLALRNRGVAVVDPDDDTGPAEALFISEVQPWTGPRTDDNTNDDSVGLYLREMSRFPLLKAEEEYELAVRIESGRKAGQEMLRCTGSNMELERQHLEALVRDGVLAREALIKANTRLVVSIARRHMGLGVAFLDLIQEGNLGLMKGVEKFDVHRGFRFSTYATWWIRQAITRAISDQARTIRLPVHMNDRIRQICKATRSLEQRLGRIPTSGELADEMNMDLEKVLWTLRVSWLPISLESPAGEDEDSEMGMYIEDETTPTPVQSVTLSMLKEKIEEVLGTLPPREARVLRLRFGLNTGSPNTLAEVGEKFGLTRERIRQIEGKALQRLRHPRRTRQLKEYL